MLRRLLQTDRTYVRMHPEQQGEADIVTGELSEWATPARASTPGGGDVPGIDRQRQMPWQNAECRCLTPVPGQRRNCKCIAVSVGARFLRVGQVAIFGQGDYAP